MAGELLVQADWAVWSKHAGTREDYSVLACSGAFSKTDYGKIISRYLSGTPDTRVAQGPGALPWVTVSWVGVDDALRLGITITDATGEVDGVGRPITRTRYLCVPYDALRRESVSYTALYEAASQLTGFPDDGRSVGLAIPRPTAGDGWHAALGQSKIEDQVPGAAAALLLNGPVSIVQAEGSTVEDRLAFIDAVASLLPYGYRAKLTAGTWSDSGVRHRLRLAFAARARDDAASVSWRRGADVPVGDSAGRRYLEEFRHLSDRAEPGRVCTIRDMAAAIEAGDDGEPQRFEQPEPAVAALREIDLPWRIRRAIEDKIPVDVAELRRVIESGRLAELAPPRTDLITELSLIGEARDWPLLRGSLDEITGQGRNPGPQLPQFAGRMLWGDKPPEAVVRECLEVATSRGFGDSMLAYLVTMPGPASGHADSVRILADLVEGAVFGAKAGPAAYPKTGQQLSGNPVALAELMAALAASGHAKDLLRWLSPQAPEQLTAVFGLSLGVSRGKAAEQDIAQLARLGDDCPRAALRAAAATGRVAVILPALTGWLAGRPELGPADRRQWRQTLGVIDPGGSQLRAYLDTALLAVGGQPTALPPPFGGPDSDYVDHLVEIWRRLDEAHVRFSGESYMPVLAGYLEAQRPAWTGSEKQAMAVADLAGKLGKYDTNRMLTATVAIALDESRAAREWPFAEKWRDWRRHSDPEAIRRGLLERLATLSPGTDPRQVAELCLRAQREGIHPKQACAQLDKSPVIDSADAAESTLSWLHDAFARAGVDRKTAAEWQRRLVRLLASRDFGRELRVQVSRAARAEIRDQLELLASLTAAGRDEQQELTDEERDDLGRIAGSIESLVKKSGKRPPLFMRLVVPGSGNGNGNGDGWVTQDGNPEDGREGR